MTAVEAPDRPARGLISFLKDHPAHQRPWPGSTTMYLG